MIPAVFQSTRRVLREPAIWLVSAVIVALSRAVLVWVGWQGSPERVLPTERGMSTFFIVGLGRGWGSLILAAMGLAALRNQPVGVLRQWVPVQRALEAGFVSLVLLVPIALGTLLFIVPGVYLALLWSQTAMVIVDRQARFFEARIWSASLTDGHRVSLLGVWAIVALATVALDWLLHVFVPRVRVPSWPGDAAGIAAWGWDLASATFGIALMAATYYELSRRAPWRPEDSAAIS